MTKTLNPDLCVIGAGAGGLWLAAGAATAGASVMLIEKAAMGGNLSRGCAPMAALKAAADHAHAMRRGSRFGIADAEPEIDFRKLRRHVEDAVAATAPNRSAERFTALGVLVLREEARFVDARTVAAGEDRVRARRFVVATGSMPTVPAIPGLDMVEHLTEETALELTRRPGKLAIVGATPASLAIAQSLSRLGAQVTLIEALSILPGEDPEIVAALTARLRAEGIDIHENTAAKRVERRGKTGIRLLIAGSGGAEEAVDATHLLVTGARRPATDGLDLEKAGIAFSESGIKVDARLRTSNRRVHAIGDVTGGVHSVQVAEAHAGRVLKAALSDRGAQAPLPPVPRAVFTDPGFAHVGLTEAEARKTGARLHVLRWPYEEIERAQAERRTTGFVKVVADGRERILGVSIVGAGAGETIGLWALAISNGLGVREMADHVPAYPTMVQTGKRAALSYFSDKVRKSGMHRILRLLRVSG